VKRHDWEQIGATNMGTKSVPLSVRLPLKDVEFIASLDAGDAVTMSEKIRHLVGEARRLADEGASFEGVIKHTSDVLAPLTIALNALEADTGKKSQVLRVILQWLPGMLATLEVVDINDEIPLYEQLFDMEIKAADRVQGFLDQLARLAVSKEAPCLDPAVMRRMLMSLTELIELQIKNT